MGVYINRLLSLIFRDILWKFPGEEKKIYLTFDDGPTEKLTPWILKKLDDFDAKATFFCLGKQVKEYPEQFEEIIKKGHSPGNHGYRHLDGLFFPMKRYINNVHLAAHLIKSDLFRPAYGRIKPFQYFFLKKYYTIVMWDVMSHDYNRDKKPERITNHILKHARPGSVLVFHDSEKAEMNVKKVLPEVLRYYTDLGYEFSSIPMKRTS